MTKDTLGLKIKKGVREKFDLVEKYKTQLATAKSVLVCS